MFCKSCGAELPDGSAFCPQCGASQTEVPPVQQPSQEQTGFQGQPYEQTGFQGQPYGQTGFQGQPYGQTGFQGQPYGQTGFQGQPYGQAGFQGGYQMQRLSRKEFLHHDCMKKCRSNINIAAIMMYVCAGITLLANVIMTSNIPGLLDVLILLGLGLWIHLGQSRVASVLACVYSIFNVIYMLVATGQLSGYLITIFAFLAVFATFKFNKAWAEYQSTGQFPQKI